jgi:hypothetical protein
MFGGFQQRLIAQAVQPWGQATMAFANREARGSYVGFLRAQAQSQGFLDQTRKAGVLPRGHGLGLGQKRIVEIESGLALSVLERLECDPFLRGRISVETVAWDKEGADTPMLASMTPQEAISQQRPKPSECEVVVVIFWSRMGTPLPPEYKNDDGSL